MFQPQQRDANDGIFNLMDPQLVAQQEQQAQQQQDQAALQRQLAMPEGDQARALVFGGARDLGRAINNKMTGGSFSESPSVARARILKESWDKVKGEPDVRKRLGVMAATLDEAGLTDDSAKIYKTLKDMELSDSKVATEKSVADLNKTKGDKLKEETDPRKVMLALLVNKGYVPAEAQRYAMSYNPETGQFDGALQLTKQQDGQWTTVDRGNGVLTRVEKASGKEEQVVGRAPTTNVTVNNQAAQVDKSAEISLKWRDQAVQELKPYDEAVMAVDKVRRSVATYESLRRSGKESSTASSAIRTALQEALAAGKNGGTNVERQLTGNPGSVTERLASQISRFLNGTLPDDQIIDIARWSTEALKGVNSQRAIISDSLVKHGASIGISGAVLEGVAGTGTRGGQTTVGDPSIAASQTTDPKITRIQDSTQLKQREAQRATENEQKRRSSDKQPQAVKGKDGIVEYKF